MVFQQPAKAEGTAQKLKLVIVLANDLDSVKLDEDERTREASTLMELIGPPIADPVLVALRRTFTISYSTADRRTSEECLRDIRQMSVTALGELGAELELLRLPRVDADKSFKRDESPKIFKYVFVRPKELRRRVTVEGEKKKRRLSEIFNAQPADALLRALRRVLSLTFREATTERQHDQMLEEIRFVAAEALVPYNSILEDIEIEAVAMPTWRRFVDGVDTLSGDWSEDEEGEAESSEAAANNRS